MSVTIFSPDGESKDYRTVSERLPEFEEAFPVADGWRVIRSHQSTMEFNSDVHRLWEAALNSGKNPVDLGLPRITGMAVIFSASLYKGGELVRNASAFKRVAQPKDWEAGETAAFQRLMAACGFGGTDLDDDDQYDRMTSGLEVPPATPAAQASPAESGEGDADHHNVEPPAPQAANAEQEVSQPAEEVEQPSTSQAGSEQADQDVSTQSAPAIRPQILNQLAHVAALAGEEVPEVETESEAKRLIKTLNEKARATT